MKKKKQHYVWRFYLRKWAINEQIYCRSAGKIFQANLMNIASENYFYKLKELSTKDIAFIRKLFIDNTPEVLQKLNSNWVDIFTVVFNVKTILESGGKLDGKAEAEFEETIINFEEDIQGKIEDGALPFLERLHKEDVSFYSEQESNIAFNYYLAVQYFRTNRIKKSVLEESSKYPMFGLDKIWNVASHILATNLAYSLHVERQHFKCFLLKNTTDIPFITGDQPVINTYGNQDQPRALSHDELELFYPIGPLLALLITRRKDRYASETTVIDREEVLRYNSLIAKASASQIYADEENVLLPIP
jgi:Protein of unknown function (DUF4238)